MSFSYSMLESPTDALPLITLAFGCSICLLGHRYSRFTCFILGILIGLLYVYNWFKTSVTTPYNDSLPFTISILAALVLGNILLLLHTLTFTALNGIIMTSTLIALANGQVFAGYWFSTFAFFIFFAISSIIASKHKLLHNIFSTALCGSFLAILSLDQYSGKQLNSTLFTSSMLTNILGIGASVPYCSWICRFELLTFVGLTLVGFYVQILFLNIERMRDSDAFDDYYETNEIQQRDDVTFQSTRQNYGATEKRHVTESILNSQNAAFNYYHSGNVPMSLQLIFPTIVSTFTNLQSLYGFQNDNISNQCEHLLMLLYNTQSHSDTSLDRAIVLLHQRIFSNYRSWCSYLQLTPNFTQTIKTTSSAISDSSAAKLNDCILWLLIWGESSNLRHMPECLAYLFHSATCEFNAIESFHSNNPNSKVTFKREQHAFLSNVVRPLVSILRSEKGDIHTQYRNYDDINEFFWQARCCSCYYGNQSYQLKNQDPDLERQLNNYRISVADALKLSPKTYLEKRHWLHPVRSFMRLIIFYAVCLHFLIAISVVNQHDIPLLSPKSNVILSSFILSIGAWSIIKELLELWATFELIKYSRTNTVGLIVRLSVKSVMFMWLFSFYIWSFERTSEYYTAYMIIATLYMIPVTFGILTQIFPSLLSTRMMTSSPIAKLRQFWYPASRLYVGREVQETDEISIYRYQIFWVSLLIVKFAVSYQFQVSLLIQPTEAILNGHPAWSRWIPYYNAILTLLSLFILWTPFVLVYMFDTVIWYFLWQAIVGVVVGMSERLGEIHSMPNLISSFAQLPINFENKIMGNSNSDLRRQSVVAVDEFRTRAWLHFAVIWNEIINDIRLHDLINNEEHSLLTFRFVPQSDKEFYLPLLLTAGVVDAVTEKSTEIAYRYSNSADSSQRDDCENELHAFLNENPLRKEGMSEIWECTKFIIMELCGDKHFEELNEIFNTIESHYVNQELLLQIKFDSANKCKTALLNLVRGLRIAAVSFEANEKQKRKNKKNIASSTNNKCEDGNQNADDNNSGSEFEPESPIIKPAATTTSSLKKMMKSPSVGTLHMLDKIQNRPRYAPQAANNHAARVLHLNLLRDQLSGLLSAIQNSVIQNNRNKTSIIEKVKIIQTDRDGLLWSDDYATENVEKLLRNPKCSTVLATLHASLSTASIDAEPQSAEATRRLLFFANSLFMDLPVAQNVSKMKSLTTLTPFHSEDVAYSASDLSKETEDGVSVFFYLQTIFSEEWGNFAQRHSLTSDKNILQSSLSSEVREWCTNRGQTLSRTVDGIMLYQTALKVLAKLELPSASAYEINELVASKCQYVVSCQVYGKQKREMDSKAADIDALLRKYPTLRVAYIDEQKIHTSSGTKTLFYSVLVKADPDTSEIVEVYRIELPDNPIIGEGKPENQNHAIIFTRSEYLQTIDMNQSNGLEEAFKIRNLLQEFDSTQYGSGHIAIVGFREYIYTGSLSSIANYMALQEGCFVTQGQRVLNNPLRTRFHYGHPDIFDKLFFMSRGGVSKASKGINLSEDIFAGFNSTLRGGSIVFKEYIQCGKGRDVGLQQLFKFEAKLSQGNAMQSLSRDVYRLAQNLDFFKLLSFYTSGVGFYISNCLTIWALHFFLFSRVILAAYDLQQQDTFSGITTISYWFGQIGFILTLPVFGTLGLERGFMVAFMDVCRMIVTGGPLFFMFHMGTKAYYFEQTILAGGAKYRPTGRGFVTRHEDFSELFRFHASSHFYKSIELSFLLIFYALVEPYGYNYVQVTWAGWLIVASWIFGPIWFNPMAFVWSKTVNDCKTFVQWMNRQEGDGDRSWKAWWRDENDYLYGLNWERKTCLILYHLRHAIVGAGLLHAVDANRWHAIISVSVAVTLIASLIFIRKHFDIEYQRIVRGVKAFVSLGVLLFVITSLLRYGINGDELIIYAVTFSAIAYFTASAANICLVLGVRWRILINWFKLNDFLIAGLMLSFIGLLSLTVIPSMIQTRLMFHNAFSRGVLIDKLLRRKEDTTGNTIQSPIKKSIRHHATAEDEHGSAVEGLQSPQHQFDPTAVAAIESRQAKKLKLRESSNESSTYGSIRPRTESDASIDSDVISVISDTSTASTNDKSFAFNNSKSELSKTNQFSSTKGKKSKV